MIPRLILIILGIGGLIGAYYGSKKHGWFQIVGEFPFMFYGFGIALGSLSMIVVGIVGVS
jgi:hypothetical protein